MLYSPRKMSLYYSERKLMPNKGDHWIQCHARMGSGLGIGDAERSEIGGCVYEIALRAWVGLE